MPEAILCRDKHKQTHTTRNDEEKFDLLPNSSNYCCNKDTITSGLDSTLNPPSCIANAIIKFVIRNLLPKSFLQEISIITWIVVGVVVERAQCLPIVCVFLGS